MSDPDGDIIDLVTRFSAGDEDALRDLISRYKEPLHRYIYRYVRDSGESDELVSQVFIRAWNNHVSFRQGKALFSTWIFGIATNLCRDHARKKKRHPADFAASDNDGSSILQQIPSSEITVDREAVNILQIAISELPHDLKTALILHTLEGNSQKEVAQLLGCTEKTVETRIYRARKLLRKRMDR